MNEIKDYLKFLDDIGINEIPVVKSNEKIESEPTIESSKDIVDVKDYFEKMEKEVESCRRCPLGSLRTNSVFGEGNIHSDLMFIGEGPGYDEDKTGKPFVGKAGSLLTKIINAIGLDRSDVFIGNIIKCRPPGNRDPLPEEIDQCRPFIEKQIQLINPKVIVTLGRYSTQTLLNSSVGITKIRGKFTEYKAIKVMPTFHPAYLLRNPSSKKDVWADVQAVRDYLMENSKIYEQTKFGKD